MALSAYTKNQVARRKAEGLRNGRINKPAKWLFPMPIEREYRRTLINYVNIFENTLKDIVYPQLQSLYSQAITPRFDYLDEVKNPFTNYMAFIRTDDWVRDLNNLLEASLIAFERRAPSPQDISTTAANATSNFNKAQFDKVTTSALGVNILINEPQLATRINSFASTNVDLITSMTNDAKKGVKVVIEKGFNEGLALSTIESNLEKQFGITKRKAELIARDQIASLNGQLTKERQTSAGIERFTWSTAQDERVRDSHAALEGKIFSWDDLPAEGAPGSEINCRCTALPVFSDLL